jgi:hypothetical protein
MTWLFTLFQCILFNNIEELISDSIDDETRSCFDCDDEIRNEVLDDRKKKCFDHNQDEKKIWFPNSTIFRRRWSYNSRIWLGQSIKLTEKEIFDSTISIKMIEFKRLNCTDCLNRERDCEFHDLNEKMIFVERFICKKLIRKRDCRFEDRN